MSNLKSSINKVVKYCTEQLGVDVNLRSNSFNYDSDTQTINCRWNASEQDLLCSMLHEVGHVIQAPSTFALLRASKKRNKALIAELEYTAWQEGWNIAVELSINTEELYMRYKQLWMMHWSSYLEYLYSEDKPDDLKLMAWSYNEFALKASKNLGVLLTNLG